MQVDVSANTVALLKRTLMALQGDEPTPAKKSLPRWLPNGEPITTLKQLAAVLCIDTKTAAHVVLDAHEPPEGLISEASQYASKKGRSNGQTRQGLHRKAAQASQRNDPRGNGFVAGRSVGQHGQSPKRQVKVRVNPSKPRIINND
jgi:hypothetical protein